MSSLDFGSKIYSAQEKSTTNYVLLTLVGVGSLTHLFFLNYYSETGGHGPATALIWGYSMMIFALFMKIIISAKSKRLMDFVNMANFQLMFLIGFMLWLVMINVKYLYKLNTGKVPNSFETYSGWTTGLIFFNILLYVMKGNFSGDRPSSDAFDQLMKNTNVISGATLFLIFVLIFIQQTILVNFSVDVL